MARTVCKTVYQFHELSDRAKENAREWYRIHGMFEEWYDYTLEAAKEAGAYLGIEIDQIYFTGFSCQGDGACFTGHYRYRPGWRKDLRADFGGSLLEPVEAIGDNLQEIQGRFFYGLEANISHSGNYCHEYTMDVETDFEGAPNGADCGWWSDRGDEAHEALNEAMRTFARWIYSRLRDEYEYLTSDEAVDETIEANCWEFNEDGTIHHERSKAA